MTADASARLPLEGVRVAAITVVWAGPHVTQVLAEWGADVVRVEPVNRIQPYSRGGESVLTEEQARAYAEQGILLSAYPDFKAGDDPWNRSPAFNAHARNKRSMACDVMSPEGREAFLRLIEHCDVFVENNVPETIERAGLTYEVLREVNPELIVLRMPAYGLDGPYKNYRAFGTHVEGMIGHHLIRSYPDQTPDAMGDAFTADAIAGVMGAFAVTAALRHRERTGVSQQIEMPLAEAFLPAIGEFILDYTMNGRVTGQLGNAHPSHAPHGVYPTAGEDRWIAIDVASDEEFAALCDALGASKLASDDRFAEAPTRWANADDLDAAIGALTVAHDRHELFQALQAAGVTAAPVHDELDALASEQLDARNWFEEIDYPGVGTHRYPGLLFKMRNTPNGVRTPPPRLGEHSREIYLELLGYSEEEYTALEARGLVGEGYATGVITRPPD
jgi:crotonobetainyl-CoA:carnitine CoA-transferase CaiB-like acyl-CoA transferase